MGNYVSVPAVATASSSNRRKTRSPKHPFHLRYQPYDIQPFALAPVLAGEKLTNLRIQSRLISMSPIKSSIIGWWSEKWVFYVPLRALRALDTDDDIQQTIENMLLNLSADVSSLKTTSAVPRMMTSAISQIPWMQLCYQRVVDEFFRDAGEGLGPAGPSGAPIRKARLKGNNFTDSLTLKSAMPSTSIDITSPSSDLPLSQLEELFRQWEILRQSQLVEMDFSEYLRQHGIRPRAEDEDRPQLVGYWNDWTYPTNTVNPADVLDSSDVVIVPAGQPSAALSMSFNGASKEAKTFREPGFLCAVTTLRPKVYINQQASLSNFFDNLINWMPAMLRGSPEATLETFTGGAGPLSGGLDTSTTDDYVVDLRDLLIYGEQFTNVATGSLTDANVITNIVDTLTNNSHKYAPDADIDNLFVSGDATDQIAEDGVFEPSILSHEANDST